MIFRCPKKKAIRLLDKSPGSSNQSPNSGNRTFPLAYCLFLGWGENSYQDVTLPTEWLLLYFCVAKYFRAWRAAATWEADAWLKTHIPQWPCVIQHSEAQPLPQWRCPSERKPGCKYSPRGLLTLFHYPWRGAGSCYDINCPLLTHQSSLLLPPLVLA